MLPALSAVRYLLNLNFVLVATIGRCDDLANIALRLSGPTFIFGFCFLCFTSLVGINRISRFQTSIVFFLRNSHLISTFSLRFCSYYCFYLTFFVYNIFILYSIFLSVEGCRATAESLYSFKTF